MKTLAYQYNNRMEVLEATANFLQELTKDESFREDWPERLEATAGELSAMLREMRYEASRLLSLHDFVETEPSRFGCPFGQITHVSQLGTLYGPEWVEITWFKWNYVPFGERDETNVIKEIAHMRRDKPAYELGLQKMSHNFTVRLAAQLKPWQEQMESEKYDVGCVRKIVYNGQETYKRDEK